MRRFLAWVRMLSLALSKVQTRWALFRFLRFELDRVQPGTRLASIGSGGKVGELSMHYAEKNGFELIQIDIDPRRRPDMVADICDMDLKEFFDIYSSA